MRQPIRSRQQQQHAAPAANPSGDGSMFDDNSTRPLIGGGNNSNQQQPKVKVVQEYGTAHLDLEARLQHEKLEGIRDIEAETQIVKELYKDFNLLVGEQQKGIDVIDKNVSKSVDHAQAAVVELKSASESQKSSRKWMCCIVVFVVLIILAIVIALFAMKKI